MAKRKRSRRRSHSSDPMKLVGYSMKSVVGVTALGITANALTNIKKN